MKGKKKISKIFKEGKKVSSKNILAIYIESDKDALFSAPISKFKRAVDRNRIKRLMKESYRKFDFDKSIAFIYLNNKIISQSEIDKDFKCLEKILK